MRHPLSRSICYLLLLLMVALVAPPRAAGAAAADYAIPNGHFYTQAAGGSTKGYALTDEGSDERGQTVRFWSEFQRLGGVAALGYPASRRFIWDGFICQVTQRAVLQWRPEVNRVYFVNVMDLITRAGRDDYLLAARQTPKPADFRAEESGLSFAQIVAKRYKLLDANPAIKATFFSVSDPLNLNGLPTAPVADMGDAFVLRAQRVIIQQWKKDMPWAKAGQVTVALGGDIAKEVGLIAAEDLQAVLPMPPPAQLPPPGHQGINFGKPIDDDGKVLFTDASARVIYEAGAGYVRINFRLGKFRDWTETGTSGFSVLSRYDQVVAYARKNGLRIVGILSNESWHGSEADQRANSAEQAGGSGENDYLRAYSQNAAALLINHYAGAIDSWEVWNEPNAPLTYLYPSNFAWLLARVYSDARQSGSKVTIISGAVTSLQEESGSITGKSSGADYLRATYEQGKKLAGWEQLKQTYGSYPLDYIGQHIYVDGFAKTNAQNISAVLQLVHDAYSEAEGGATSKKVIITEFGWTSRNVSESNQAANMQVAFTIFKSTPYIQSAFWFFLRDEQDTGLFFGLLRPDGSEKPSWNTFRTVAGY